MEHTHTHIFHLSISDNYLIRDDLTRSNRGITAVEFIADL